MTELSKLSDKTKAALDIMDSQVEGVRAFEYVRPEISQGKKAVILATTDRMFASVQVLSDGGENNLHSHPHQDGFWMVLNGRVNFYGEGDELIASLGRHEGVLVPRGTKYWFESASDEPLELLQVEAFNKPLRNAAEIVADRVSHAPLTEGTMKATVIDGRR